MCYKDVKRAFDLISTIILLLALIIPILVIAILVIAILVRLTSRGPALYWSDRDSWNMDPDLLAEELEKGPERVLVSKAVVAGHLWLKLPYLKPACICETKNVIIIVSSNVL